jgi:serpin B
VNVDRRGLLALSGALLSTGALAGCAGRFPTQSSDPPRATATATRTSPDVDPGTVEALVDGNTAFGLALHRTLVDAEPDSNAFLSPYSLSLVLAMAWAGAAEETRSAMADALRFRLDGDRLHPAFNRLDRTLEARTEAAREAAAEDDDYRLTAVNVAWTQDGYPFRDAFLDTLARHYGVGMNLVDFRSDPDAARTRVNDWVANETDGRIADLLPEGVVTELTRLVPTNAVDFDATWAETFEEADTRPGASRRSTGPPRRSRWCPRRTGSRTRPSTRRWSWNCRTSASGRACSSSSRRGGSSSGSSGS